MTGEGKKESEGARFKNCVWMHLDTNEYNDVLESVCLCVSAFLRGP